MVPFVQADQVSPEDPWVPREKYKDRELEVCLVKLLYFSSLTKNNVK